LSATIPDRRRSGIADRRKTRETDLPPKGEPASVALMPHAAVQRGASASENAIARREADILRRENLVANREQALRNAQEFSVIQQDLNLQLMRANEKLVIASVESQEMAEDLERSRAEMAHLANHDFLTDLPNRMQLHDRIGQAITLARRHRTKLAVLFLDLDKFKAVNDSLGHAVGDQLLQAVAERLMSMIRRSDTVSRHGGDEFVLLLSEVNEEENLRPKIEKIRHLVSSPYNIAGNDLMIGVTIGVSIFPEHGDDTETLVRRADLAMYYAKQQGRNQYQFFSPEMTAGDAVEENLEIWQQRQMPDLRQLVLF
jgi:diguanylate cyclase (GGDEF)-like protein